MYLDDPNLLPSVLQRSHFTILLTEADILKTFPTAAGTIIPIPLGEKGTHDIETIRNIETLARAKYTTPVIILLPHAQQLTTAATHAFLKLLEEPSPSISFLFTAPPGTTFLETILSRAKLFHLRTTATAPPDAATLAAARTLVAGNPKDIIPLATALAKSRPRTLEVTRTAIHQLHQSQLQHPTPHFLARLEKLLALEQALSQNGHIKLHIVNII